MSRKRPRKKVKIHRNADEESEGESYSDNGTSEDATSDSEIEELITNEEVVNISVTA